MDNFAPKTGRHLDAVVAVKIMGWKESILGNYPWQLIPPEGDGSLVYICPRYSADKAMAFMVEKAMFAKGCNMHLWRAADGKFHCAFIGEGYVSIADTPEHAICAAALMEVSWAK